MIIMGLAIIVAFTPVTVGDLFASILALVPTGWGILSVSYYFPFLTNIILEHNAYYHAF